MAPSEWDALPWWQQRMYLDGYVEEGLLKRVERSADPTVVSEEVHRAGSTTVTDRTHKATFSLRPGEVAAFGIRERTI